MNNPQPLKGSPMSDKATNADREVAIKIAGDITAEGIDLESEKDLDFITRVITDRIGCAMAPERALAKKTTDLLHKILPMAMNRSCAYADDPGADPTEHCCDWNEVVEGIRLILSERGAEYVTEREEALVAFEKERARVVRMEEALQSILEQAQERATGGTMGVIEDLCRDALTALEEAPCPTT